MKKWYEANTFFEYIQLVVEENELLRNRLHTSKRRNREDKQRLLNHIDRLEKMLYNLSIKTEGGMTIVMDVYVVEAGDYEDRHICGIYQNEEDAKMVCENNKYGYETYSYYKYEVDNDKVLFDGLVSIQGNFIDGKLDEEYSLLITEPEEEFLSKEMDFISFNFIRRYGETEQEILDRASPMAMKKYEEMLKTL